MVGLSMMGYVYLWPIMYNYVSLSIGMPFYTLISLFMFFSFRYPKSLVDFMLPTFWILLIIHSHSILWEDLL